MSRPSDTVRRRPVETSEKLVAMAAAVALLLVLLQHTSLAPLRHASDDLLEGLTIGLGFAVLVNLLLRFNRVEG